MTANKGNRRYMPIEKYPLYNDFYDREMLNSHVFNQGDNISSHTIIWTKKNISDQIYCYVGDKEGFYYRDGERLTAYLPQARRKLKEIETRFENYKLQMLDEGYEEPTKMPEELQILKYQWEAKLDVREKELIELQKRLASFIEDEKKKEDEKCLTYGLIGSGRLSDGVLVEIDNQKVIRHKGVLVIENGPYRGLQVSRYRKLCNDWQEQRKKADEEENLRRKEKALKQGLRVFEDATSFGGGRIVDKSLLPKYPAGVRNWFEDKEEEASESVL